MVTTTSYLTLQLLERWATVGIVPVLKDERRGGGMQPLTIIGQIHCEMSSRQKSKRKVSSAESLISLSYHRCESHHHYSLHSGPFIVTLNRIQYLNSIPKQHDSAEYALSPHPLLLLSVCRTQGHLAFWWRRAQFEKEEWRLTERVWAILASLTHLSALH